MDKIRASTPFSLIVCITSGQQFDYPRPAMNKLYNDQWIILQRRIVTSVYSNMVPNDNKYTRSVFTMSHLYTNDHIKYARKMLYLQESLESVISAHKHV